jgi:hypothetical protein
MLPFKNCLSISSCIPAALFNTPWITRYHRVFNPVKSQRLCPDAKMAHLYFAPLVILRIGKVPEIVSSFDASVGLPSHTV